MSEYKLSWVLATHHHVTFTTLQLIFTFSIWVHILYYSFDTGEYHESVALVFTRVLINTANQTRDILLYPMNNKFITYCSCLNTIVTNFLCNKHLYYLG